MNSAIALKRTAVLCIASLAFAVFPRFATPLLAAGEPVKEGKPASTPYVNTRTGAAPSRTMSFQDKDGNRIIVDKDTGTTTVKRPDGSYQVTDAEGKAVAGGKEGQDNVFVPGTEPEIEASRPAEFTYFNIEQLADRLAELPYGVTSDEAYYDLGGISQRQKEIFSTYSDCLDRSVYLFNVAEELGMDPALHILYDPLERKGHAVVGVSVENSEPLLYDLTADAQPASLEDYYSKGYQKLATVNSLQQLAAAMRNIVKNNFNIAEGDGEGSGEGDGGGGDGESGTDGTDAGGQTGGDGTDTGGSSDFGNLDDGYGYSAADYSYDPGSGGGTSSESPSTSTSEGSTGGESSTGGSEGSDSGTTYWSYDADTGTLTVTSGNPDVLSTPGSIWSGTSFTDSGGDSYTFTPGESSGIQAGNSYRVVSWGEAASRAEQQNQDFLSRFGQNSRDSHKSGNWGERGEVDKSRTYVTGHYETRTTYDLSTKEINVYGKLDDGPETKIGTGKVTDQGYCVNKVVDGKETSTIISQGNGWNENVRQSIENGFYVEGQTVTEFYNKDGSMDKMIEYFDGAWGYFSQGRQTGSGSERAGYDKYATARDLYVAGHQLTPELKAALTGAPSLSLTREGSKAGSSIVFYKDAYTGKEWTMVKEVGARGQTQSFSWFDEAGKLFGRGDVMPATQRHQSDEKDENKEGEVIAGKIGEVPAAFAGDLVKVAQDHFGSIYQDKVTGQFFGQSLTGAWHTMSVDKEGEKVWGGNLREGDIDAGIKAGKVDGYDALVYTKQNAFGEQDRAVLKRYDPDKSEKPTPGQLAYRLEINGVQVSQGTPGALRNLATWVEIDRALAENGYKVDSRSAQMISGAMAVTGAKTLDDLSLVREGSKEWEEGLGYRYDFYKDPNSGRSYTLDNRTNQWTAGGPAEFTGTTGDTEGGQQEDPALKKQNQEGQR